jgi:hypothetical protein
VSCKALNKFALFNVPDLYKLVISGGYEEGAIRVERNAFDWSRVAFHDSAGS